MRARWACVRVYAGAPPLRRMPLLRGPPPCSLTRPLSPRPQVRIAQLRQLPHQPKRKLTLAAVREQHASYLYNRQSLLNQRTSEMAAQARGM